jgi:hypothetical protein
MNADHAVTGSKIILGREEFGAVFGIDAVTIQVSIFWGVYLKDSAVGPTVQNSKDCIWSPRNDNNFAIVGVLGYAMPAVWNWSCKYYPTVR